MPFLEKIRIKTQGLMIKLKKKKFHFDSCTRGPYPGTESNILILDPGLYYKGFFESKSMYSYIQIESLTTSDNK